MFGAANIALKENFETIAFRTYINGRLTHEGDSNLPIITVAGNLNSERAFHVKPNSGAGGWFYILMRVNGYSGREGQGSKCRFILLCYLTGERSRSLCMNFGSLTIDFLIVKTSFPMGFAVGINFENFTQRTILACGWNKIQRLRCFRIK